MTTIKLTCPECGKDVSCPVGKARIFEKGESDSSMLVLFECPGCRAPHLRLTSSEHLEVLILAGVQVADIPKEFHDPVRSAEVRQICWDDVLDFGRKLESLDLVKEAGHGPG